MFHKFEQALNVFASGTIGTFCVRCHQQVATQMGEPRELALWERSDISREGVTCITCHRVNAQFGKVNGERHIEPAPLSAPVYGAGTGKAIEQVLTNAEKYEVSVAEGESGTPIHSKPITFEQISKANFVCHVTKSRYTPVLNLKLFGSSTETLRHRKRVLPAKTATWAKSQENHMDTIPGRLL